MPAKIKDKKVLKVREVSKVSQVPASRAKRGEQGVRQTKSSPPLAEKISKVTKKTATAEKKSEPPVTAGKLTAEVYDIAGKKQGSVALPKEIFGVKVNKKLLAQALHIYFANRSTHSGSAKTRSEMRGGGAKPWRQKGTGRARAGSRRSPLWVGGAKALGPKHRNIQLTLPKKMKRAALLSALTTKAAANQIKIISNIEKIEAKTKLVANLFRRLETRGSSLIIISANGKSSSKNIKLAARNIPQTAINSADNLNAYETIKNRNIFMSREALVDLPSILGGKNTKTQGVNA